MLLDATAALLSERNALDVALSEIARRANLNSALIKYYFGNKEGLLLTLLERDADREMGALSLLVEMDLPAEQKLKVHIGGAINAYDRSPYLNRLIHFLIESGRPASRDHVVAIFIKPLLAAYEAIIAQGVAEGAFRPTDPALLYYSLLGACDRIFHASYTLEAVFGQPRVNEELKRRYTEHVKEIVLRGLAR